MNAPRLHVDVVHPQRGSLTEAQTAVAEDEDERAHAARRDGHPVQLLMTQVALLNLWQRRQFDAIGRTGWQMLDPYDFNTQLGQWLPVASSRWVRVLDGRPVDVVEQDRAAMLALPPVAPTVETLTTVRLGRDYYVRVAGNDYSVDPVAIGQLVDVRTGLRQVRVCRAGRLLATHDRCWASRQTLTDPAHVETAAVLRHQFQQGSPPAGEHPERDLADYDRAFGVDFTLPDAEGEMA